MAKRYALVPENWLSTSQPKQPRVDMPTIVEHSDDQGNLSDLADLLPKSYRNKAKMLLHYLNGHVKLNEQQRVMYGDALGSHILDLVRYFVSPFKTDRPPDAPKFENLIKQAGVPKAALRQSITTDGKLVKWKKF